MAKKTLRIKIPKAVGAQLELGKKVNAKHKADGVNSPLRLMQGYNWDDIGPKMEPALDWHNKAEEYRKLSEHAYEQRNILMGDVDATLKATRDVLKGTFKKTPKTIGDWGYEVDDTPKAKPVPPVEG